MALAPGNLIALLINTQVLNGIVTPIILGFILVLANRPSLLGDAVNGCMFRKLAAACVFAVGLLAAFVMVQLVLGWLGVA